MKLLVKNPLDKELKITFKGKEFSLAAQEEKELDSQVVTHWKRLHAFLEIKGEAAPSAPVIPQAPPSRDIPVAFVEPVKLIEEEKPKNKGGRPKKIN